MINLLVIAICAVICGADDWVAIEKFGHAKKTWFKTFLDMPHGIPSHDTFGDVFARLNPEVFARCFLSWINGIAPRIDGEIIAVDGKTARRSHDRRRGKAAIHLVSAWACKNRVCLGQVSTDEKSNEITAIPELLTALAITGCIVTIDAMGTQKAIAQQIVDQGADYVLALKDNHPHLYADVIDLVDYAIAASKEETDSTTETETAVAMTVHTTVEKGHGRIEERTVYCINTIDSLIGKEDWKQLSSIAMVKSSRTIGEKTSIAYRYYISSRKTGNAKEMAEYIRSHWGVENDLHWCLDIAFREDDSRMRLGHSQENFGQLRRMALSLLKQEETAKVGLKNKRLMAGWDDSYLAKILSL